MWLAKQQKRERDEPEGSVGEVTLAGEAPAVELESERRGLTVYAPGGYRWRPVQGQKVLVLKADGDPCVTGTPAGGGVEPGEVVVESAGGAYLRLDNEGTLTMGPRVDIEGEMYLNGEELEEVIRRIAIQIIAAMMG